MYIAFEGIDGSGKDTQLAKLREYFYAQNKYNVCSISEPSRQGVGEVLRSLFISDAPCEESHLFLFIADRLLQQHKRRSLLDEGNIILSSRCFLSNLVYQSSEQFPSDLIEALHKDLKVKPNVIVVLDVDPSISLQRIQTRNETQTCYETFDRLSYYRNLYKKYKHVLGVPVVHVNGTGQEDEVHSRVLEALSPYI